MEIIALQLRKCNQHCYIDLNNNTINKGMLYVIETEHGLDIGKVFSCCKYPMNQSDKNLEISGKIIRESTDKDLNLIPEIELIEEKAYNVCLERVKEKKLQMKLIYIKCLFDKTKIIFYFVAENRIDFRELVRDLAAVFRTRIEMRQIGVRDEAKIIGGFGLCGREMCCAKLGGDFDPVSIKMAKEQNLNLNSQKISGMCGRLLCCLGYEYEYYRDTNQILPNIGSKIRVGDKVYPVVMNNILKESVRLKIGQQFIDVSIYNIERRDGEMFISQNVLEKYLKEIEEEEDFDDIDNNIY